ncbi:MAG: glycosyltransferase, partial [Brevundimonas sp.]
LVTGFDMVRAPYAPLSFPVHERPRVSVVVPAHNKFGVTYYCLSALLFASNRATFEVIVVDDGSSDETRQIEEIVSGIKVVRHESALGFVDACNDGVARASGDYVVLLNNDTEPTLGWLDEMLATFDNFDAVGIVGAKLVYPDGRLQEAGGIVWKTGDPWNYGRGGNAADPKFNYVRQADYLSGACIMLPTALWTKLGGLSEIYRPAYFEDTDLCFKVKAEGLKVVYNPFCVIYHFEGVSSGTDTASGMKRFQEVNRPTFKARWTELYKDNGPVGVDVELNKDRGVARRALMLDLQVPRGDNDAGSYAAMQEIRLLQSLGFKVTFAPRNSAYLGRHTERIQKMGVEAIYGPYVRSVEELLTARGREFDLVYVTRYTVAQDILPLIRRHAPQARIAFCNADLHFLREMREAVLLESGPLMERAEATREAEMAVAAAVDVTLSYNDVEHEIMRAAVPGVRVAQAPWVVDVSSDPPGFDARRDITFLGGFGHPPNRLAVEFFGRDVVPGLREALPDVTCNVFGSGITAEVEALARDGLAIRGFAPDLKAAYDSCRVFIAPVSSGAGLKGKVIDALAYGTPSVLSPVAAEGANLRDGVEVLIARTPREWIEAITRLYQDPELWAAMSKAAQAHARRYYSFEAAQAQMRQALEMGGLSVEPDPRNLVTRRARLIQD